MRHVWGLALAGLVACGESGPVVEAADAGGPDGGVADLGAPLGVPWGVLEIDVEASPEALTRMHADPWANIEVGATVRVDGRRYPGAQIEVHGGYARTLPKLSYRLKFPSEDRLQTVVFGPEPEQHRRLVLQASWVDPTYARNCLTLDLVRALGGYAPRCQYANLALNGVYVGFYVAIERIDEVWLARQGLDPAGLLIKAESHLANWAPKADPLAGYAVKSEGAPTDAVGPLLETLAETPLTFADFEAAIRPLLNLDGFMVWQRAHTLANNRDTFTKNYYLYFDTDDPGARFELISWDADATWGLNWDGAAEPTVETRWHGDDAFSPRLFAIATYREEYRARYAAMLKMEATLLAKLRERAARIRAHAQRDLDAWSRGISFEARMEDLEADAVARFATMRAALP